MSRSDSHLGRPSRRWPLPAGAPLRLVLAAVLCCSLPGFAGAKTPTATKTPAKQPQPTSPAPPAPPARQAPPALPKPGSPNFAVKILTRFDDLYRGQQSTSVMTMSIQTEHWHRTLKMRSWSLGKDYSLVRILSPKKERGTATLKVGKDLFTYLSKTGRTIKVGGGMMAGSWMGSHFTNDDLVRETRLSEDFVIKQLPDEVVSGVKAWTFELVPKPDAAIVWGKVQVTVRQADAQPLRQRFYDEDGKLTRTMTFSEHTRVGSRVVPLVMTMVPNDRPKDAPPEWTKVRMSELNYEIKLTPAFFSLQRLKSL